MAYVYDAQDHFPKMFNASMVDIERLSDASEIDSLRQLVADHLDLTASPKAAALLQQWGQEVSRFWKVVPHPPEAKPASKPVHELNQEKPTPTPAGGF